MLKSIFLAIFDVHEGPKVLHQVPTSSITASPSSPSIPLLHFPPIANTLIPHPHLCNNGLLQLTTAHHRILSYPQCIPSPSYPRNAYTFNFCLVLAEDVDFSSYIPVIRKLNTLFRTLEEQTQFLSKDDSHSDTGKIYALCEILLEDLNNYSEAMIPIDDSNTLNIKLFPTYPPPPPLYAHHVPLSIVRLEDLIDENWDLTMLRILPHINGINSVKQISLLADADLKLVKKAIRHLLYYGCLLLLDVFSFSAIYACTAEISELIEDEETQDECSRYVALRDDSTAFGVSKGEEGKTISGTEIVELYLSLRQGLSIRNWCYDHDDVVSRIDIRRFVTFGVIKGFLYRVHKYAFASTKKRRKWAREQLGHESKKPEVYLPKAESPDKNLEKYLDGTHCFDEICTDLMISEKDLVQRLKAWEDVQVICR